MLDLKESDFESMKSLLTSKLKEVEQQFIEANQEMKNQLQDQAEFADQEQRGESDLIVTIENQRAKITQLEFET